MNKSDLIQVFPTVAESAIQKIDDEWLIVGKYCQVAYLGEEQWDLWLCNPKDLAMGLSTRKLNAILQKLRQEATFTELTGEAYTILPGKDLIENNLDLLGIKRRKRLSDEQKVKLGQQIDKINAEKADKAEMKEEGHKVISIQQNSHGGQSQVFPKGVMKND